MYTILHDLTIKASSETIYNAVSDPKHLNNWWTLKCEGCPLIGESYQLYFAPEYDWRAEVTLAQFSKHFELTLKECSEDWEPTKFGFTFKPVESQSTMVAFYHSGWEVQSHHYRRTSYCWAILLHGLKQYLEKGVIIPFDKRA